ncbi:hypothetical protein Tco_1003105 [Tanacetum coccineum]|uniref:Uncharacterized protein n=1 Tax=Tanacetum coccineum TaxID=301880 RepID=A0ABQ5FAG8_9ASTR
MTVLLYDTSGCGKSTLSALLVHPSCLKNTSSLRLAFVSFGVYACSGSYSHGFLNIVLQLDLVASFNVLMLCIITAITLSGMIRVGLLGGLDNGSRLVQASRLGITTVISTDSIRHMMRSFIDEKQNLLLWSSTYHVSEHLDPVSVSSD